MDRLEIGGETGGARTEVVVSAPGKVLITGGYLILERPHSGLVLSTSARFFAIVEPIHFVLPPESWSWSWADVEVSSPQMFRETSYKISLRDFRLQKTSISDQGNPFVENSIQMAVAAAADSATAVGDVQTGYIRSALLKGLRITILGNNAFYSFRKQMEAKGVSMTSDLLASLPEFSPITNNPASVPDIDSESAQLLLPEVAKTGLGSSAAMTTAVAAAVLQYLRIVRLPLHGVEVIRSESRRVELSIVHSVSQAAHCAAQGKVGSGFDVSSAVYGSQRYVRFSPSILSFQTSSSFLFPLEAVKELQSQQWDSEITAYALPPRLLLIVGEPGYGGSHTPSMVGAVLWWRKQKDARANQVFTALSKANSVVEGGLWQLNRLSQEHRMTYVTVIDECSRLHADKWGEVSGPDGAVGKEVVDALMKTRKAFLEVRSGLRLIGEEAKVPIEPPIQSQLLDDTMGIDGVLFAGVPGAGGYDAVFAIALGQDAKRGIEVAWSQKGVWGLQISEDPLGVCSEAFNPTVGSHS